VTPAPQTLTVVGVSFAKASLAVRQTLGYTLEAAQDLLRTASIDGLDEAVVISTCHQTEFYLVARRGLDVERAWTAHVREGRPGGLTAHARGRTFRFREADAARHLFRLACALDPEVPADGNAGPSVKQALACAADAGTLGPILDRTFQQAFATRKATLASRGRGRGTGNPSAPEAFVEEAVERWRRWRWAQPGETLLRQVFQNEHACRTELVEEIIAAGFAGRRDDLDYLIRRAWRSALQAHARGLRSWLQEDACTTRSAR
jgi:hypothetical protein